MKTIKLYGHLGKQFGKIHKYMVDTPSEAIRLLCANYKGFESAILGFSGAGYKIIVGNAQIPVDDLNMVTGKDIIKIIPIIQGRGDSTMNMLILGGVLIATGMWWAAPEAGIGLASGSASAWASGALVNLGQALIFAGISAALFSPTPVNDTQAKLSTEGYFDGAMNTSRQGVPVPLGYGKLLVGSAIISAGMFAESIPI